MIFLDEKIRIQTSLGGLEKWTETCKMKLIEAVEFSIQSKIFIV